MISRKPTHPGVVLLEDVIKPLGLTITDAARMLGVSRKALSEFVNEKAMLSPDMAIRIAKATNIAGKLDEYAAETDTLGSRTASSKECYPISIRTV